MRSQSTASPGALTRTVEGSVGRIFASAPHLEPNDYTNIDEDWENLDGEGTHGDVVLSKLATYAVLDGYSCALIDAPTATVDQVPLSDVGNHQPRWIIYRRAQVLSWRWRVENGNVVITRLNLSETADVDDGAWGIKSEDRVRVLRNEGAGITAEVWAERQGNDGQKHWTMIDGPILYTGPKQIPFAVFAGGKMTRPFVARPPLLLLCDKVIEFFQVACDVRHYERVACFPQPVLIGQMAAGSKLTLGPSTVVECGKDGDFKWAELTGTSMDQLRQNQADRRQEIGMLGLSFLMAEKRVAETAKAKQLDSSAENATIVDAAKGIEDGANQALAFHVSYWGIDSEHAPTVSLNKNLSGDVIDATLAQVLLNMRAVGELTRAEYRQILARGRIIPDEMALEDAVNEAEIEASLNKTNLDDQATNGNMPPSNNTPATKAAE